MIKAYQLMIWQNWQGPSGRRQSSAKNGTKVNKLLALVGRRAIKRGQIMDVHWYLVRQEGRYPWKTFGDHTIHRSNNPEFMRQLAQAIDYCDFDGALLATSAGVDDAWTVGAAVAPLTKKMKFIIAQHAGVSSPLLLAQQATTFHQYTGGRLIINVVTGSNTQGPPHGLMFDHDERYTHADEYWSVWKRIMAGETVTFEGRYIRVANARLASPIEGAPVELYFGGSSEAAIDVAAKHVDLYLSWGEPPPVIAEKIAAVRARAAHYGRTLRFGLRINLLVRETDEEAWEVAERMYSRIDTEILAAGRRAAESSDSVGTQRMDKLIHGKPHKCARDLELYPDMWAGLGLVSTGPISFTIIGSPETVANRIAEYRGLGIDAFIFSSFPLIEEAYRTSDLLMPLLRSQPAPVQSETVTPRAWAAG